MNRFLWTSATLAIGLAGGLAACGAPETSSQNDAAEPAQVNGTAVDPVAVGAARGVATLRTAQGAPAGTATATAGDGGIMLALRLEGLPPGQHGVHVHMTGRCDGPSFESAGSHWNPSNAQHGLENPQGQHAGDMPNLTVDENGRGTLDYTLKGGSLDGLLDSDAAAMVIHASADDQKTDPSGNSGDRIACGVFEAG